jgi:lipopolysaccharide export LptBFGC system permease protein LptF
MKLLLQRYLAAQFILPLIVSTLFFICFLLTFELFRLTELLVTRDISVWFILSLIYNISLTFVPLSLPIAVLFSTIFCMNRVSGDSEYIAMRAGGLTKFKILIPFLVIALMLSASVYQLNQTVIPQSNKDFRKKVNYLTSSGLLAGIKEGQFFTAIPKVTLFASEATKYGQNLRNVFLHIKDPPKSQVIFAKRGQLFLERSAETLSEKLTLTLFNGNIVTRNQKKDLEKILFQKYIFPISQNQFKDQFDIKETMLTSEELKIVLNMPKEEAQKAYDFNEKELFNAKYEFWNRKNGAIVCFIFCFLGFTIGVSGNRGKARNSGLLGVICLIIYYATYFSLVSLAKKHFIPIPMAVFIPSVIMVLLGLNFYKKLDWQS